MKELTMEHTTAALDYYDKVTDVLLSDACMPKGMEQFEEWENQCKVELLKVQVAFFLDTDDRNTLENCESLTIGQITNLVKAVLYKNEEIKNDKN